MLQPSLGVSKQFAVDLQSPLFTSARYHNFCKLCKWSCRNGMNFQTENLQPSQLLQISWGRGKVTIVSLLVSPFLWLFPRWLPLANATVVKAETATYPTVALQMPQMPQMPQMILPMMAPVAPVAPLAPGPLGPMVPGQLPVNLGMLPILMSWLVEDGKL